MTATLDTCVCACHHGGLYPVCSVNNGCGYLHQQHSDPRRLRAACDQLRAAVAELADPRPHRVVRDDGTATIHLVPSLLDQLHSEIGHGSARPGNGSGGSRLPVALDVLELCVDIETGVDDICTQIHASRSGDTRGRLHRIANTVGAWTDATAVLEVAGIVERWIRAGRSALDPPRRLHLAAACPACGTRMVWRTDDTGTTVQTPALYVDGVHGCSCLACGHAWPTSHLEFLAEVLGCPPLREDDDSRSEESA